MTTTKSLVIAALAALSLGVGTAMAQESAGGVGFGPYETDQLNKIMAQWAPSKTHDNFGVRRQAPQAGSSDVTYWPTQQVLQGGD